MDLYSTLSYLTITSMILPVLPFDIGIRPVLGKSTFINANYQKQLFINKLSHNLKSLGNSMTVMLPQICLQEEKVP